MKISVVIPSLNAAITLPATLAAIGAVAQIVIADAGGSGNTPGATVIAAARGRGIQLAAGIAAATQDWLLLLHADTRLQPGWRAEADAHMRDHPDQAAFFRFALDSTDPRARRLERLVAWRCRVMSLPYGDQGLLIHRTVLAAAGGIRPLPLMEDVDLIRRLGRHRLRGLDSKAVTSAVKWEQGGWLRRSARNLGCLSLWRLGVNPAFIARLYE